MRVKATIIIKEVRQIVKYMPEKRAGIKPMDVLRADKKWSSYWAFHGTPLFLIA